MIDPRPDLSEDSKLWTKFLNTVLDEDEKFAYVLHGFRCLGLRLREGNGHKYILRPDLAQEWANEGGYQRDKDIWLVQYGDIIVLALDKLTEEENADKRTQGKN